GGDDCGVFERAGFLQRSANSGDGRALLADRDVDAAHLLLRITAFPGALLVHDRVDCNGSLPGLAVTDDQLPLATADRDHGVDGLDPGLQWLIDSLPIHHTGGLQLERATLANVGDLAEPVDRIGQRIDGTSQIPVTNRHRKDVTSALDDLAFLDAPGLTHDDYTDLPDVKVQRDTKSAVLEREQLVGHRRRQALDPRDSVAGCDDCSNLFAAGRLRRVVPDEAI